MLSPVTLSGKSFNSCDLVIQRSYRRGYPLFFSVLSVFSLVESLFDKGF